jgi:hypothetical protein
MPDNQTLDEWLALPSVASDPNALGTGVAIARPGAGKDHFTSVTYDDMLDFDRRQSFFALRGSQTWLRLIPKFSKQRVVAVVVRVA